MLSEDDIRLVRSSVTMRQVAQMYGYRVTRSGFMRCPFHGDKNPSLKVYEGSKGYHCFVCGKGGDIFDFVMNHDGLKFGAAVRRVAGAFGIPISDGSAEIDHKVREQIARREAGRKAEEEAREQAKKRLNELGGRITTLQALRDRLEPFSDAWCACQNMIDEADIEWNCIWEEDKKRERKRDSE